MKTCGHKVRFKGIFTSVVLFVEAVSVGTLHLLRPQGAISVLAFCVLSGGWHEMFRAFCRPPDCRLPCLPPLPRPATQAPRMQSGPSSWTSGALASR